MKKILTLFLAVSFSSFLIAQRNCGTMLYDSIVRATNPEYVQNRKFIEDYTQKYIQKKSYLSGEGRGADVITIPVVVHVVWKTADENISDEQVLSQIDVLNEDFRRLNADATETPAEFETVASDFQIEFCLASKDPDGNPTTGIIRTETDQDFFGFDDGVKSSATGGDDAWPADQYLNIWVCNLGDGLLGYATFPGGPPSADGVVIIYSSFGRTGFVIPPYDLGRTATHEVGHWVNLYHIWGDDADCSGSDLVDDTPNQEVQTFGCPSYPLADACNSSVMFENYMDYTDDACYNLFTEGQKERSDALFIPGGARSAILSSTACIVSDYDAAAIDVISPVGTYCYSTFTPQVTIKNAGAMDLTSLDINYSIDGAPALTYFWTGSLATFETEVVTLPTLSLGDGAHTLDIDVENPSGNPDGYIDNNTTGSDFFINTLGLTLPLIQGFEDVAFPYAGYTISNPDSYFTWEYTAAAGKSSSSSMYMNHFENNVIGSIDEIQLPAYNFSGISTAHLNFDVAYAPYSTGADYSDTLEVLVSSDCGVTWNSIYKKFRPDLATSDPIGSAFVPTQDEWRAESLDLTPYISDKVIVKFKTVSNWENNLYVDNINIASGSVAINEINETNNWFTISPNPAGDFINVQFYAEKSPVVFMQIYNMLGALMMSDELKNNPGQLNQTSVFINNLPAGYYTIKLNANNYISEQTFVKE